MHQVLRTNPNSPARGERSSALGGLLIPGASNSRLVWPPCARLLAGAFRLANLGSMPHKDWVIGHILGFDRPFLHSKTRSFLAL